MIAWEFTHNAIHINICIWHFAISECLAAIAADKKRSFGHGFEAELLYRGEEYERIRTIFEAYVRSGRT